VFYSFIFVGFLQLRSGEVIDPNLTLKDLKSGQHITRVKIDQLFLLMGKEVETLEAVPAGNVLGEFTWSPVWG
jgi:translation elongation factor EF-G